MEDLTYYFGMDLLVWFSDPGYTTDYYMFQTSTVVISREKVMTVQVSRVYIL